MSATRCRPSRSRQYLFSLLLAPTAVALHPRPGRPLSARPWPLPLWLEFANRLCRSIIHPRLDGIRPSGRSIRALRASRRARSACAHARPAGRARRADLASHRASSAYACQVDRVRGSLSPTIRAGCNRDRSFLPPSAVPAPPVPSPAPVAALQAAAAALEATLGAAVTGPFSRIPAARAPPALGAAIPQTILFVS